MYWNSVPSLPLNCRGREAHNRKEEQCTAGADPSLIFTRPFSRVIHFRRIEAEKREGEQMEELGNVLEGLNLRRILEWL